MSVASFVSDDEIWARAIARCEQLERNAWMFGAFMGAVGGVFALIGRDPGSFIPTAILAFVHALIVRLDVHYWRIIGFAPVEPYWRRALDLAPQFAAVGAAGGAAILFCLEYWQPAPANPLPEIASGIALLAGGLYGVVLALALAVKCDLAKARRWFE